MHRYIQKIQSYIGIKRYFLSFFLGCLTGLALSPTYLIPLAVIGLTSHLWQIDSCTNKKQSFWLGWFFGLGFFVTGLYWISFALLIDIRTFGWMIPFAMFGIPAVLAFYSAICSLITFKVSCKGYKKVILFAAIWTTLEILRGFLFTGFPWNLIGYIWTFSDSMLQITSIMGIFGLSLLTVFVFAMPYSINWEKKVKNTKPTILALLLLFAIFIFGQYRLSNGNNSFHPDKIRIVQGNIAQNNKWDARNSQKILNKYISQSVSAGFEDVKYILWPEAAVPFYIEDDSPLITILGSAVPQDGYLLTGTIHGLENGSVVYNAIHTINQYGEVAAIYHKSHLVPFGEYVPLRSILPIDKITPGQVDFSKGDGITTLDIKGMPSFSPLICYEAIFPNKVIDKNTPPQFMINVTNDAWYGNSSGPYQHFNMVKVRAVEHGIPLIRAANTGISGVIDAYGRIIARTSLGEDAVLDSKIPQSLTSPTLYTKFGNLSVIAIMIIMCGICYKKKD